MTTLKDLEKRPQEAAAGRVGSIELFQKPDGSEYLALRILTRTKDGGRGLVRMSFGATPEEAIRKEEALHEDALARMQSRTVRKHKAVAGRKRQSLKAAEGAA